MQCRKALYRLTNKKQTKTKKGKIMKVEKNITSVKNEDREEGVIIFKHNIKRYGFVQKVGEDTSKFFYQDDCLNVNFDDLRTGMKVNYLVAKSNRGDKAIGIKYNGEVENV